jgi:hypothetical protein
VLVSPSRRDGRSAAGRRLLPAGVGRYDLSLAARRIGEQCFLPRITAPYVEEVPAMSIDERSRRELYQALAATMGDGPATSLMDMLPRDPASELVTRTDMAAMTMTLRGEMAELRGELKVEMSDLRSEWRGDMAALRTELKGDMAALRTELKDDMAALRTELKDDMGALRSEFGTLRGEFGELRAEFGELRGAFGAIEGRLEAKMARQTYLMMGTMIGTVIALVGYFSAFG